MPFLPRLPWYLFQSTREPRSGTLDQIREYHRLFVPAGSELSKPFAPLIYRSPEMKFVSPEMLLQRFHRPHSTCKSPILPPPDMHTPNPVTGIIRDPADRNPT